MAYDWQLSLILEYWPAFLGGFIFRTLHVSTFHGLPGTIFVAFIGAVVLLVILHLVRGRPAL